MPFDFQPTRTKAELTADPQRLLEEVKAYFDYCESTRDERELKNGDIHIREKTPSILGLSQYLHTHRNTITRLIDDAKEDNTEGGEASDAQSLIRGIFTYARQEIELRLHDRSMDGDAQDKIAAMQLSRLSGDSDGANIVKVVVQIEGGTGYDPKWGK